MSSLATRSLLISSLVWLASSPCLVFAQSSPNFRVPPPVADQAAYQAGVDRGLGAGYQAGFRLPPIANPYYATGLYAPYVDPLGGFMNGTASVVGAQGQFLKDQQQASLQKERVKQTKLETRRKSLDEWNYERANTPTLEDERERSRMENMRRSRNDPPITEIWSGKALNDLLFSIQHKNVLQNSAGPPVPLDEEVVRHINVTSGTNLGGIGMLKDGGKLRWPIILQEDDYTTQTKRLEELVPQALQQAQSGPVDFKTIRALQDAVQRLQQQLKDRVSKITPTEYVQGKRYLRELENAIQLLQDNDATNYVTRKWSARGNSVSELIAGMTQQGLKFAPAVGGDEAYYVSLHQSLVRYDIALSQYGEGRPTLRNRR